MDKEQKQVIERLENIVYLYNRESRGWYDCNDIRINSNDIKAIKKAIELVKAIPSAEPKPGQWILLDECSNSGYYCSECHKKVVKEGWSNTVKKIKYCPNCGAKMFEPQERSDKE